MPLVVIACINPRPQNHADVARGLAELVPVVHSEKGCEIYALHDSGTGLVMVEQWTSQEDLELHAAGHAVLKMKQLLRGKLANPVSTTVAVPVPAGSNAKGILREM
ncbi:putative quinol monooxygenase [Phycicoccus sp. Soil803]|uniref:putative quinol monooxygenase n=1 Tax=Phycicoccus sp. Soil803 TaxID=1736415 RepID=UPI00070DBF0C|nr:antibiotic biosynthesis monooxygenase [Phycicoccus sp. Soil803]